jgi:hypothetical protein
MVSQMTDRVGPARDHARVCDINRPLVLRYRLLLSIVYIGSRLVLLPQGRARLLSFALFGEHTLAVLRDESVDELGVVHVRWCLPCSSTTSSLLLILSSLSRCVFIDPYIWWPLAPQLRCILRDTITWEWVVNVLECLHLVPLHP